MIFEHFMVIVKELKNTNLESRCITLNVICLGKGGATKSDEFSEKFERGGGSFSIQKSILQILGTLNRVFDNEIDTE